MLSTIFIIDIFMICVLICIITFVGCISAGTYSTTIGATLVSSCLCCPINSYSNAGSAICQTCAAGIFTLKENPLYLHHASTSKSYLLYANIYGLSFFRIVFHYYLFQFIRGMCSSDRCRDQFTDSIVSLEYQCDYPSTTECHI